VTPSTRRSLRRRLRPYRPAFVLAAGGLVAASLWLLATGLLALRDLRAMQQDLDVLDSAAVSELDRRGSQDSHLVALATSAAQHGQHAGARADDFVWKIATRVPGLSRPARAVVGVTQAARTIGDHALVPTAEAAVALRDARSTDGRLDLRALRGQAPALKAAATASASARDRVASLADTGVQQVDDRLDRLERALGTLASSTRALSIAADVGPGLLGFDGSRRYLVAVQNNAESRASGGIVGAYGLLRFDEGRPVLETLRSDADLEQLDASAVDLGEEWRTRYERLGQGRDWREVTASPDFPTVAKQMLGMWAATHDGQQLDGVVSLDPLALSDVLQATGSLRQPDGRLLSPGTFPPYVLSEAYRLYPDKKRRTEALTVAARTVLDAVVDGRGRSSILAERLGHAMTGRHLAVYSRDAAEQAQLARTPLAGALPRTAAPVLGVMTQEALASKLSFYLRRTIRYDGQPVTSALDLGGPAGPEPVQYATVTVTLRNAAPRTGLTEYVAPSVDITNGRPVVPGTDRIAVSVYLGRAGAVLEARLDGRPISLTSETEQGMSVVTTAVTLPPGGTATLQLRVVQPAAPGAPLTVIKQPLVIEDAFVQTGARTVPERR
jgi:hypothetical protein